MVLSDEESDFNPHEGSPYLLDEEDEEFPVSHRVPPALLGLEYKNCPDTDDAISSGFPILITFEIQPEDTEQPWYHGKLNRDGANSLLRSRGPGTFLLR